MDVTGITPRTKVFTGTIGAFFDQDFSGTLDDVEIDFMSKSDIKQQNDEYITLSTPNGEQTYNNIGKDRGQEYYQTGSIPVAVVDCFSGAGAFHGNAVSNILKEENSDINISRFDLATAYPYSQLQKWYLETFASEKGQQFLANNPKIEKLVGALGEHIMPSNRNEKSIELALGQVLEQIKNGQEFKAINLSQGFWCNYEDINKLMGDDIKKGGRIGEMLTPENVAKYKTQIKQILKEKVAADEKTSCEDGYYPGHQQKIKDILSVIDKMEELKIPIYNGQSYLSRKENSWGAQTFNWLSLADNARTVEAGKHTNGQVNSPIGSTSSFALDENGKRRIASPLHYNGDGGFDYASTSFATPMVLARELKEESEKE